MRDKSKKIKEIINLLDNLDLSDIDKVVKYINILLKYKKMQECLKKYILDDKDGLDSISLNILELLRKSDGLQTHQLSKIIGLSPRTTCARLWALHDKGLTYYMGSGKLDPTLKHYIVKK